jgi:hypothetical protein
VSILAFGGEMGFFIPSDASSIETTADVGSTQPYNSSFARCGSKAHGPAAYLESTAVAAQADLWTHFDIVQSAATPSSTIVKLVEFIDGGGIERVRLTGSYLNTGGTWQMERWTGSAWVSVGNFVASSSVLQTIDIHIVSNTASGSIKLYVAGTKRIDSGTVDLSAFSGITKIRCWGVTRGISSDIGYSQIVLASESTVGMRVGTIVMTGQGNTHSFDTGGFANIDETVYSDADFIQSGTAAQIEQFTGTAVPSFTGYSIRALALTARAKTSGSAPTKMRFSLRSAGTDYLSGSDITLDAGYGAFCAVWETNPATSAAFLSSEIAALQYGVKSVT